MAEVITVILCAIIAIGVFIIARYFLYARCPNDGTILVEAYGSHWMCPQCSYVKHVD